MGNFLSHFKNFPTQQLIIPCILPENYYKRLEMSAVERSRELSQQLMTTTTALAQDFIADQAPSSGGFLQSRLLTFHQDSADNYTFVLSALWEFSDSDGNLQATVAIQQDHLTEERNYKPQTVQQIFQRAILGDCEGTFTHSLRMLRAGADIDHAELISAFDDTVTFIKAQLPE